MMRVEFYQHGDKIPFNEFWKRLRDNHAKKAILQRLHRVEMGNFGDWKSLGEIGELRIPTGPATGFTSGGMEAPWFFF